MHAHAGPFAGGILYHYPQEPRDDYSASQRPWWGLPLTHELSNLLDTIILIYILTITFIMTLHCAHINYILFTRRHTGHIDIGGNEMASGLTFVASSRLKVATYYNIIL